MLVLQQWQEATFLTPLGKISSFSYGRWGRAWKGWLEPLRRREPMVVEDGAIIKRQGSSNVLGDEASGRRRMSRERAALVLGGDESQ